MDERQHAEDLGAELAAALAGAAASPVWPERLREVAAGWAGAADLKSREARFVELWTLLQVGLLKYVRLRAWRSGGLPADEMRDIASEKALDLVMRLDRHEWRPGEESAAQVCAYLAATARNGVVDAMRRRGSERIHEPVDSAEPVDVPGESVPPAVEGVEFARGLRACLLQLTPRARLVWWLRAFHELPASAVADHPKVHSTPGAVDVMYSRARDQVRDCLASRGYGADRIPPGTIAALWDLVEQTEAVDEK